MLGWVTTTNPSYIERAGLPCGGDQLVWDCFFHGCLSMAISKVALVPKDNNLTHMTKAFWGKMKLKFSMNSSLSWEKRGNHYICWFGFIFFWFPYFLFVKMNRLLICYCHCYIIYAFIDNLFLVHGFKLGTCPYCWCYWIWHLGLRFQGLRFVLLCDL